MAKEDLGKFLIWRNEIKDKTVTTKDAVYIETIESLLKEKPNIHASDFAVICGTSMSKGVDDFDRKTVSIWALGKGEKGTYPSADAFKFNKEHSQRSVRDLDCAIRPCIKLQTSKVIDYFKRAKPSDKNDLFELNDVSLGDKIYYTMEFGEYPQTYVGDRLSEELEDDFRLYEKSKLTGKKYLTFLSVLGEPCYVPEYIYNGEKYVRVKHIFPKNADSWLLDGTTYAEMIRKNVMWFKVEPIKWIVKNWDKLPKTINPDFKGPMADYYIDLVSQDAIICGLPFYPKTMEENSHYWQNSTIRGFLNGINVNNIKSGGDLSHTASGGGDYSQSVNFLNSAFDCEHYLLSRDISTNSPTNTRPRKNVGISIQQTPMKVQDQINFYITKGKSFMLHGVSGIGKTRRVEEADPNLVSIVLRNGILPEEVIGKTIYPNNDTTKAGRWVSPAWYEELCQKCKEEPDKNHVLFIDEITNVKPSEQSLVFHLVLKNSIGPNIGQLPDNVVVVAAGNSKEESEAAYNMPEPLFRRFSGHIYLKPDVLSWLEWGSEPNKENPERTKIHPIVSNFVGTYSENVFYSKYDAEDPAEFAVDPRAWEQVSDIIYDNNNSIAKELIENKVGKEIATSFVEFAQNPPLTLEEVLNNEYTKEEIPTNFDAKYALALSLLRVTEENVSFIREFIQTNLGNEILQTFDSLWVGKDNERAILISGLRKYDKAEGVEQTELSEQ